jgi:hypothetical protein
MTYSLVPAHFARAIANRGDCVRNAWTRSHGHCDGDCCIFQKQSRLFQNRDRLQRTRGFGSFQCRHSFVARETIPTAFSRRDESLQCLFFLLLSEQPSIWNNMTRLGGGNPRKAMRILLYQKKFHDTQDLERRGELLERFQEMPSTRDRPVDPFLVMAMIAVPK